MTFVLDKSEGFTQAGVERLNDSIRIYVWAILGAQAQTPSNNLKTGTAFDAQKHFLAYIEDVIASPVDIPSSIARYRKTLGYAFTPLDFVCEIKLCLMPSDMALYPWNVQGYNDEIQIARSDAAIRHNPGINEAEPINPASKGDKALQGKTTSPAGTVHKGHSPRANPARPRQMTTARLPFPRNTLRAHGDLQAFRRNGRAMGRPRPTKEKTALMAIGIAVGLVVIWLLSR